jgi:hypothetical protein
VALISEFLNELAANDELLETYAKDPVSVMDAFGLDEDQQALILEGDPRDIRTVLEAEVGPTPYIIVRLHMIIVRRSGPGKSKSKPKGKKK